MKTILMSIKPKYSQRIFAGTKLFELRRTPVRLDAGDTVIVYESSPRQAVVGAFIVGGVVRGEMEALWRQHGEAFGVSHDEYLAYFEGARAVHAIEVAETVGLEPVDLNELRDRFSGFRPPQSYMRWRPGLGAFKPSPTMK